MLKVSQEHLKQILISENVNITLLRGKDGIERYKELLLTLIDAEVITINAVSKLVWKGWETVEKEILS